jgi:hypothetical protein
MIDPINLDDLDGSHDGVNDCNMCWSVIEAMRNPPTVPIEGDGDVYWIPDDALTENNSGRFIPPGEYALVPITRSDR